VYHTIVPESSLTQHACVFYIFFFSLIQNR
jgi:hypothetical protein